MYKSNMKTIQSYNLFGEHDGLPDVVHCEEIETRSLIHDWEFQPHRHARLHQFLLLDTGEGTATLDERRFELSGGMLVNVPTGAVHSFSFVPYLREILVPFILNFYLLALSINDKSLFKMLIYCILIL